MERAQRAADSPLRAILEAARFRRRVEPEPTGADAEAALRRATALRAAQAATAADVSPVTVILTLPETTTPPAAALGAGLGAVAVAPLPAASAVLPVLGDAARAPLPELPPAAPQLVHMVQPEVPQPLLEQLGRAEVTVEFVIAADGRVSGVSVLPPVPRPLVPLITAAIEQWRYAPAAAARPHRVQLVFTGRL